MGGCVGDVNDHVIGTKGQAQLMKHTVTPFHGSGWEFEGEAKDMYQVEHDELFAGIRSGKFINDGDTMTLRGWGERNGVRIGFGEAAGKVLP